MRVKSLMLGLLLSSTLLMPGCAITEDQAKELAYDAVDLTFEAGKVAMNEAKDFVVNLDYDVVRAQLGELANSSSVLIDELSYEELDAVVFEIIGVHITQDQFFEFQRLCKEGVSASNALANVICDYGEDYKNSNVTPVQITTPSGVSANSGAISLGGE